MASDLSKIIPENLSDTLSDLLAKDTSLKECTKVDKRDFENSELIKIDVEFAFDKLTSIFSYYVPAQSASLIFNIMMGAPNSEISSKIDDDTADAMAEFISNTCGGLVTTINASSFEDIGNKSKFNIKHKEIFDGNSLESVENIYRFLIDIDEKEIVIFTQFEENFIGFITELTNMNQTFYPEEVKKEVPEEVSEEVLETETTPTEDKKENKEEIQENETDSKAKKLKKIIIIIGGLITLTLIIAIIMYMMGMFDPEPIKEPKDINTSEKIKNNIEVIKYKPSKKIDFKMSDINVERLNSKLELLTKYQILTQEELEAQAQEEKQRIIQLKKEQELIEFAKQNKEEPLIVEEKQSPKESTSHTVAEVKTIENEEQPTPNISETSVQKPVENTHINMIEPTNKLKFVLVNSLKYKLFKELVLKTNSKQARISICNNDNGKTQIFIGPFENEELQIKMNSLIRESTENIDTLIANITQKEFDTKCNF